jgi:hypothetical protein
MADEEFAPDRCRGKQLAVLKDGRGAGLVDQSRREVYRFVHGPREGTDAE